MPAGEGGSGADASADAASADPVAPSRRIVMRPQSATQAVIDQDRTFGRVVTRIGRFSANYKLSAHQVAILERITPFFTDARINDLLRPVIDQTGPVSLRLIDWACTNYSRGRHATCTDLHGRSISIHTHYRQALNLWRRKHFDPFRRRLRLKITHKDGDVVTTLGQLNYTKWVFESGILDYVVQHSKAINENMALTTSMARKRKREAASKGEKHRRGILTKAAPTDAVHHPSQLPLITWRACGLFFLACCFLASAWRVCRRLRSCRSARCSAMSTPMKLARVARATGAT